MGFFGKKEKKHCPVCGNEMGFFSSVSIADGEICEACEKMVRGQFEISEYWSQRWGTDGFDREDYKLNQVDPIVTMTVAQIREMVEFKNAEKRRIMAQVGDRFSNVAKIENWFTISPPATAVGIKRAKAYAGRTVATCMMVAGEIQRGDEVLLAGRGGNIRTTVLDVILCSNSSTFETELAANIGRHRASEGESAWIFLDILFGAEEGMVILKP